MRWEKWGDNESGREKKSEMRVYCKDRRSGYFVAFCPASIHSLQLATEPSCLISPLLFHIVQVCWPHPWPSEWAKQSMILKVEAGAVNWLHEPNSRSDLYHCGERISLSPGLVAGAYNNLELSEGEMLTERRRQRTPKTELHPWDQSCPLTVFTVTRASNLFDEGQLWLSFSVQKSSNNNWPPIWMWLSNNQHKEENLMGYTIHFIHKKKLTPQENHTFSWN